MNRARRYAKPLFWAALIFAYVSAIMPPGEAPKIASNDKVEHMIAFFTLAVLARLAYVSASTALTWLLLAGFGAAIEFSQMIPALGRDADVKDWIADVVALSMGIGLVALVARTRRGSAEQPGT